MPSRCEIGMSRIEITPDLIQEALKNHEDADLPDDARLLRLDYDGERALYIGTFESAAWGPTDEATLVPFVYERE